MSDYRDTATQSSQPGSIQAASHQDHIDELTDAVSSTNINRPDPNASQPPKVRRAADTRKTNYVAKKATKRLGMDPSRPRRANRESSSKGKVSDASSSRSASATPVAAQPWPPAGMEQPFTGSSADANPTLGYYHQGMPGDQSTSYRVGGTDSASGHETTPTPSTSSGYPSHGAYAAPSGGYGDQQGYGQVSDCPTSSEASTGYAGQSGTHYDHTGHTHFSQYGDDQSGDKTPRQ